MAARLNRYYNDPGLAQGFANLAELFKPPSGAETYAYAKARQATEEAERTRIGYERLSQLYGNDPRFSAFIQAGGADAAMRNMGGYNLATGAAQPGAKFEDLARLQIGAGKSFGDTSIGFRETQAGLDRRNAADNDTKLQVSLNGPIAQDAVRYTTPQVQQRFGLPAQQLGAQTVKPEERNIIPSATGSLQGSTPIEGRDKPLTTDQFRARQLQQRAEANPNDPLLAAVMTQGVTPQQIRDPVTGQAKIVTLPEALGQQPAPPTPTGQPKTSMAKTPDGRQLSVTLDPTQGWVDSQTRQPIPSGSTVFDIKAQDTMQGVTNPTTANQTSANNRAAELVRMRGTLDIYENILRNNPGAIGLPGLIRGTAQNAIQVAQDMARSFGTDAPTLLEGANSLREKLNGIAPELFDPAIPEAQFLQGTLAYGVARTENPSGEVSRQAYERALERVRGGALSNTASSLAAVGAMRKVMQQEEAAIGALRNPGGVTPGAPAPQQGATPAVRWGRDANGNPVRIQGP